MVQNCVVFLVAGAVGSKVRVVELCQDLLVEVLGTKCIVSLSAPSIWWHYHFLIAFGRIDPCSLSPVSWWSSARTCFQRRATITLRKVLLVNCWSGRVKPFPTQYPVKDFVNTIELIEKRGTCNTVAFPLAAWVFRWQINRTEWRLALFGRFYLPRVFWRYGDVVHG